MYISNRTHPASTMLRQCTRDISLRRLLQLRKKSSSVTVLRPLVEEGPVVQGVSVTLADNPAIIVCHHPPNKVTTITTSLISHR